jgi:hypothetical protein
MSEVPYGRYEEAYRAIHSALSGLIAPPPGKRITKLTFTWNVDGTVQTLKAYMGDELLFTITFTWNPNGTLSEVART